MFDEADPTPGTVKGHPHGPRICTHVQGTPSRYPLPGVRRRTGYLLKACVDEVYMHSTDGHSVCSLAQTLASWHAVPNTSTLSESVAVNTMALIVDHLHCWQSALPGRHSAIGYCAAECSQFCHIVVPYGVGHDQAFLPTSWFICTTSWFIRCC